MHFTSGMIWKKTPVISSWGYKGGAALHGSSPKKCAEEFCFHIGVSTSMSTGSVNWASNLFLLLFMVRQCIQFFSSVDS